MECNDKTKNCKTKEYINRWIGSTIFAIFLPFWCIIIPLYILFLYVVDNIFNTRFLPRTMNLWGRGALRALKWFTGLQVQYSGPIPKKGVIIASQHQSVLEILALSAVLNEPVFVLKKSLTYIPIFGNCLKVLGMVAVDRKSFNRRWMEEAEQAVYAGKSLIIFPEGTRVEFGQEVPYKSGVFKLAQKMNTQIVPVATDAGLYWPRRGFIKKSGTATIAFGEPIDADPSLLRTTYKELTHRIGRI